jgi:hypothetical protein
MPISNRTVNQFFNLRHIIGALLAAFLALWLAGCSAVKLGYNNAPELSYWWLDSYLDLNEVQSLRLRADLTRLQIWHRQNELPHYVNALVKLQTLAPANVNAAQVCALFDELRPRLRTLLEQTEPTVVALAPTLTSAQLDHLARQFDKRNQKWRAEWLDGPPSERTARRVKQLRDRLELFYGSLEEPQLAALRGSVAESIFDANLNLHETLRRQQDALQILRRIQGALDTPGIQASLRALLERSLNSPDASYRDYAEKLVQENCRSLATLHNSATSKQRLKLLETLQYYEADARALMVPSR